MNAWKNDNILDDVEFKEEDLNSFKNLLNRKEDAPESALSKMHVGQILKGRIVELNKEYVVVDVGLKSEGLVPISEFSNSEELF